MAPKKILLLAVVLLFVATVSINTAYALTLWEFGIEDQSYSEFATVDGGSFEHSSVISVGNVNVDNPVLLSGANSPGYLYTHNPYPQYNHVTTSAVKVLSFEFTLENNYSQLDLSYGRFGSEIDHILFDGVQIFSADGSAEGQWDLFEYAITGNILAGNHALTLAYAGGDAFNGHYIDFLRLGNGILAENDDGGGGNTAPVPEPGTIFLIGTGIAGLLGYRKKILRS
jgi:hypothetical protein